MKKLILSIFFILLSVLFVIVKPSLAVVDQNERWSEGGKEYSVQRDGNNITLTAINPKVSRAAGIPSLVGTINGTTFTGKQYLLADGCPSLEGYVPASGTVSADGNSIRITFTNSDFFTASCTVDRSFEDSFTYTKTNPQNSLIPSSSTPKPSPTPTETPLNLNGTWTAVNNFGTSFTFSGRHNGNSLTLQITDSSDARVKDSIGKVSLSGTLSGHAFTGTQILIAYAQECLGKYWNVDATGTVAKDGSSITVSHTNFKYKVGTCAKSPGTEFLDSFTYSRVIAEKKPTNTDKTKQVSPSPDITSTPEKPSVGVSSRDLRELARANAEFQEAQAVLDKIKADKDQRFEDKRDFANQLQDALQKYPEEQQDTLQIMRDRLEEVKSDAELYQKAKDFADWVKGSDLDTDSGGIGVVITVGNGLNDFLDLKNDGVSTDDAVAKVLIDSIAVDINPFVKTADMIATLPDEIMAAIGIPPNHWFRKPAVYLHDNSPSAFVELTTDAMIKSHSWENVGGAIQVAWEDVKSADGFGEKAQAMVDLVGTAVGAIPVAIAMQARDTISTIFDVVKAGGVTNFLINQFWLPD